MEKKKMEKKTLFKIIAVILALLIVVGVVAAVLANCGGDAGDGTETTIVKKVIKKVVKKTDDDDSNDDEYEEEYEEDDESYDDEEYANQDIGTNLGYDKTTKVSLEELLDVDTNVYTLYSQNSTPLSDKYQGFTGTVYWSTEYSGDEVNGRYYTEEMKDAEWCRLRDAGFRYIRVYVYSTWMYTGDFNDPWDWDNERMKGVYKFIQTAKSYGITPIVVVGSSMAKAVYGGDTYTPDCYYLYPRLLVDGKPQIQYKWGHYFEQIDYELQWKRYGDWAAQLVQAFKDHDAEINNILLFTEPHEDGGTATGAHGEQHLGCFTAIHEALKDAGLRDSVKIYGPNQGNTTGRVGLAKLFMQEAPDVFDVYTSHYTKYGQASTDDLYDYHIDLYTKYMQPINDYEIDKPFWVDEFSVHGDYYVAESYEDTFIGTHHCATMVAMINAGISGFNAWQVLDQAWPFYYGSGGEFKNGAQVIGAAQSFYANEVPYPNWYAITLISRYMSGPECYSYHSYAEQDCGLYTATVKLASGDWSVVVVNMSTDTKTFNIEFDEALNTTLYRYLYSPGTVNPTVSAKIITADRGFTNVQDELSDTLSGGSVAVYSTIKNFG